MSPVTPKPPAGDISRDASRGLAPRADLPPSPAGDPQDASRGLAPRADRTLGVSTPMLLKELDAVRDLVMNVMQRLHREVELCEDMLLDIGFIRQRVELKLQDIETNVA